ncbi:50S ribosomal protein L11 [Candidatus Micrarchaeota archaeon]|nr:50S ribosomal protein L11 [Candidatus Micrarchaeota archaeon]
MAEIIINAMVEGGSASAGPPLGPALGPLKVNIGQVIAKINEKTKGFKGIKVPVKVIVDKDSKEFRIEVGSPPVSELLKKKAGIEKGRKEKGEVVGDIKLESVIELAKSIRDKSLSRTLKSTTKEVLGTCISLGLNCNGKPALEVIKEINDGKHDTLFSE